MKKFIVAANLILLTIILIVSVSTVTFAWFSYTEKTQPIFFYVSKLEVEAKLYYHDNPDFDGTYDQNGDYYTTYPADEISDSLIFTNVIPGQIYAFVLVVDNLGNIDGNLTVEYELSSTSDLSLATEMDFVYYDPNSSILKEVPLSTTDSLFGTLFTEVVVEPYDEIEEGGEITILNRYYFKFQIRINGTVGNMHSGKTVMISNFIIRLDQIQEL